MMYLSITSMWLFERNASYNCRDRPLEQFELTGHFHRRTIDDADTRCFRNTRHEVTKGCIERTTSTCCDEVCRVSVPMICSIKIRFGSGTGRYRWCVLPNDEQWHWIRNLTVHMHRVEQREDPAPFATISYNGESRKEEMRTVHGCVNVLLQTMMEL